MISTRQRIEDFEEAIKKDYSRRYSELSKLKEKLLSDQGDTDIDNEFRKVVLVFLYANYEGFIKYSLELYIETINSLELKCCDVNYSIALSSINKYIDNIYSQEKHPKLKNFLPDDTKLHAMYRKIEFLKKYDNFWNTNVSIPDEIINTESNLMPYVLKKLLYILGLDIDWIDNKIVGNITRLVKTRHNIAHGVFIKSIDKKSYNEIENSVFEILDNVTKLLINNLTNGLYLKSNK